MKFLCDSCKAKYQIPDEKIAGRTLRMKCRKCGHGIVLKGPSADGAGRRTASSPGATRRRGGASVSKRRASSSRHSALGAEFRKSATLSHGSEAPPARSGPEWHVAINDVPVGPVRREELARKIGSGAVDEDSLCWREGFDDWRPLGEVAELATLLEQRRGRTPPRTPPPPRPNSDDAVIPPPPPPAPAALAPAREPSMADLPIGAPLGDSLPPPADSLPGAAAMSQAPSAAVASVPPSTAPPPRRRGLPIGAWIAMVGAGAFGIALAVLVAGKLGNGEPGTEVARAELPSEASSAPAPQAEEAVPSEAEAAPAEPTAEEETAAAAEETGQNTGSTPASGRRPRTGSTMTETARATSMSSDEELSDEQRALLARLGGASGSSGAAPSALMVASRMSTDAAGSSEPLDSAAISRVVNNNRSQLQRCYERHGGTSGESRIRINIDLSIGASGTVTRANARGSNNSLLTRCIEGNVRRWRFARSADGAQTTFPVVFSPGG